MFNIIICDDNADFADRIYKQTIDVLSNVGCEYKITRLYNGIELIEYCRHNTVDIILADIDMPKMNGFEAVEELQKQQSDASIIFVTAHEEMAFQAYDYNVLYSMTAERVVLILLTKVLLITVCCILLKFKFNDVAKRRNMIVLIIMPVVAELSMVGIMQVFLQYSELKRELLLATASVMFANFLTYYVFVKINAFRA